MPYVRWFGAIAVVLFLSGCASTVSPGDGGGSGDAASADGGDASSMDGGASCVLPNGARCPAGTSCPAGDGCNSCSCPAAGGAAMCTLRDCPPPPDGSAGDAGDAGASCRSGADCVQGEVCVFSPGCPPGGATGSCQAPLLCDTPMPYCGCAAQTYQSCQPDQPFTHAGWCEFPAQDGGMPPTPCRSDAECATGAFCDFESEGCNTPGTCRTLDYCSLPVAPTYCGCDGVSFDENSNCTRRPYLHAGACNTNCEGAALGPNNSGCLGPNDGPLPVECCYGYNCDQRQSTCDSLPPACAPGSTASLSASGCWGPCVPDSHCAPIACASQFDCPNGWACGPAGQCAPPQ